ncbi:extensin [Iris pallida]|uniref:Extensin n=1 Tax=Iris pallida TaxID=29817 RepID=A0AAX6HAC0_IRIPA|nr:extensin [Iris pallida]
MQPKRIPNPLLPPSLFLPVKPSRCHLFGVATDHHPSSIRLANHIVVPPQHQNPTPLPPCSTAKTTTIPFHYPRQSPRSFPPISRATPLDTSITAISKFVSLCPCPGQHPIPSSRVLYNTIIHNTILCPTFRTPRHHHSKHDTSKNPKPNLLAVGSRLPYLRRAPSRPTQPARPPHQRPASPKFRRPSLGRHEPHQLDRPPPLGQSSDISPPPDPALAIPPRGVATVGAFPNACRSAEETSSG